MVECICHGCGKRGHYKSMCKSKPQSGHSSIRTVQVHSDVFLGTVHSDMAAISAEGIPWTTNVTLKNRNLEFKIDTGADVHVTVIPEADYRKDQDGPLRISERSLTGAGQHPLHVCGQFLGCLKRKEVELQQDVSLVAGNT